MRKILFFSLFSVAMVLPTIVIAGAYYVTQNGSGLRNGQSITTAWSVADFNSSNNWSTVENSGTINPGDTVYFSGTITSKIKPAGSGRPGKYITLDGYKDGTTNPVRDGENINACLVYSNINPASFHIEAKHYIIVQDFRFTNDHTGSGDMAFYAAKYHATTEERTTNIIVRRNHFKGIGAKAVYFGWADDCTFGGAPGDGNVTLDCGVYNGFTDKQHLTIYQSTGMIASYNKMGNSSGYDEELSQNIMTVHGTVDALIEYNDIYNAQEQGGLSIKEGGYKNQDIIVRFNHIHDNDSSDGRALSPNWNCDRIFIYGNRLTGGLRGTTPSKGAKNLYYWANVIDLNDSKGLDLDDTTGDQCQDNSHFYNNTIYGNASSGDAVAAQTGVFLKDADTCTYGTFIKNNIYSQNGNPSFKNYAQVYIQEWNPVVEFADNLTYHSSGTVTWWYAGAYRSLATMQGTYSQEIGTVIDNPDFASTSNGLYPLASVSPAIDTATTISDTELPSYSNRITIQGTTYCNNVGGTCDELLSFAMALDPNNTDWTTVPPTVAVVNQGSHGAGWEKGAYVYTKESSSVVQLLPPQNVSVATPTLN